MYSTSFSSVLGKIGMLLICFLGALSPATADKFEYRDWSDHAPSALAPFGGDAKKLARIAGDEILIFSHPAQATTLPSKKDTKSYTDARYNTAALVIDAPVGQVRELLADYESYVGLYPALTRAKVKLDEGDTKQVEYRIEIPIPVPVLRVKGDVVLQHTLGPNSLKTLIIKSPIPYASGTFEWYELAGGKTLLTLTQWGDLDNPKGWVIRAILKAMPEIKAAAPQSTSAFVLESIRRRFVPKNVPAAIPRTQIVPKPQFSREQLFVFDQLVQRSGHPVMISHAPSRLKLKSGTEDLHFVTAIDHVNAPVNTARTLLGDPRSLPKYLRQVKKVTQQPITGKPASDNHIRVGVGLGVITIPFDFKMRYINEASGSVRYSANGGDLEFLEGRMRFDALDSQTRVIMTSTAKVTENAPFLLRIARIMPYHEYLPAVGTPPLLLSRVHQYLRGELDS